MFRSAIVAEDAFLMGFVEELTYPQRQDHAELGIERSGMTDQMEPWRGCLDDRR